MCVPRPVGTRGGVGWMRGPCACPRPSVTILPHGTPTNRIATRTSTRPPPCPSSAPCPYRTGIHAFPSLVVNNHQDRGRHITGFGRQHSLSCTPPIYRPLPAVPLSRFTSELV